MQVCSTPEATFKKVVSGMDRNDTFFKKKVYKNKHKKVMESREPEIKQMNRQEGTVWDKRRNQHGISKTLARY